MPWKTRRVRRYYYRSRREGGRVVSEYVGAGPDAELIAGLEGAWSGRRDDARERERDERRRLAAAAVPLEAFGAYVDAMVGAALRGAGFHQHKRQWRKRRVQAQGEGEAAGGRPEGGGGKPAAPRPRG